MFRGRDEIQTIEKTGKRNFLKAVIMTEIGAEEEGLALRSDDVFGQVEHER